MPLKRPPRRVDLALCRLYTAASFSRAGLISVAIARCRGTVCLEKTGETHISTQPTCAQAASRLSGAHGDQGGAQAACPSSRKGPQASVGL